MVEFVSTVDGIQPDQLGPSFKEVCGRLECELLDLDEVTSYSPIDGAHLDEPGHMRVAAAVEERVREMLEPSDSGG